MPIKGLSKVYKAMDKAQQNLNNKVAAIYIEGLKRVVLATPVGVIDGGRARNNWFLSADAPSSKVTQLGSSSGHSSIARIEGMPKIVLGRKLYFTNNMPYIETLEYGGYPNPPKKGTWIKGSKGSSGKYVKLSNGGFSKAAPEGMARIAIKKMAAAVRRIS